MLFERDNNEDMEKLDFGYAQTKWVAEQLVFSAEEQGLKVRVYRPSFITASRRGVSRRDDIVIRLLAFMINHGIAVKARNQVSFLPADIAADNIVAIFSQRQPPGSTFHVTVDDYYNLMEVTRLIANKYGYEFEYYDIPNFIVEMKRRCTKDDPLYPLLDFFSRSGHRLVAMQHKRYNNDTYRKARQLCGKRGGDPPLQDTVSYLIGYMIQEGLIPPGRGAAAQGRSC
jgi:thioester reductase-like protein